MSSEGAPILSDAFLDELHDQSKLTQPIKGVEVHIHPTRCLNLSIRTVSTSLLSHLLFNSPILQDKWKLIPAFIQTRGLVRQHIDSFNHFVGTSLHVFFCARTDFTLRAWNEGNPQS